MKEDFDIEKLDRKMPYDVPEGFFSEVQERVLQQTVYHLGEPAEPKIRKINKTWMYAAAVTVFGFLVFFTLPENQAVDHTKTTAQTLITERPATVEKAPSTPANSANGHKAAVSSNAGYRYAANTVERSAPLAKRDKPQPNEKPSETYQTYAKQTKTAGKASSQIKTVNMSTANMDQMLDVLPASELADLAKNTEIDVYLDLYN